MLSAIICLGAFVGLLCVGACCADTRANRDYEYHKYLERNKKAPPTMNTLDDWSRYL